MSHQWKYPETILKSYNSKINKTIFDKKSFQRKTIPEMISMVVQRKKIKKENLEIKVLISLKIDLCSKLY